MVRGFVNGPGDRGFNPRSGHTKDKKIVHCKVRIKGK